MVVTKPGVRFVLTPAILKIVEALIQFDQAPMRGQPKDLVITSGCDGTHLPTSKHYLGEALDIRAKSFSVDLKPHFRAEFEKALGPMFRVLHEHVGEETEHFHCQVGQGIRFAGSLTDPIAAEYRA